MHGRLRPVEDVRELAVHLLRRGRSDGLILVRRRDALVAVVVPVEHERRLRRERQRLDVLLEQVHHVDVARRDVRADCTSEGKAGGTSERAGGGVTVYRLTV